MAAYWNVIQIDEKVTKQRNKQTIRAQTLFHTNTEKQKQTGRMEILAHKQTAANAKNT